MSKFQIINNPASIEANKKFLIDLYVEHYKNDLAYKDKFKSWPSYKFFVNWFVYIYNKMFCIYTCAGDKKLFDMLMSGVSIKELEQMEWEKAQSEIPEQECLFVSPVEEEPTYE